MKSEILARYTELIVGPAKLACVLCQHSILPGEKAIVVPADAEENARMEAGKPYTGNAAHRTCMARMP